VRETARFGAYTGRIRNLFNEMGLINEPPINRPEVGAA
jgi:hypothetical protein